MRVMRAMRAKQRLARATSFPIHACGLVAQKCKPRLFHQALSRVIGSGRGLINCFATNLAWRVSSSAFAPRLHHPSPSQHQSTKQVPSLHHLTTSPPTGLASPSLLRCGVVSKSARALGSRQSLSGFDKQVSTQPLAPSNAQLSHHHTCPPSLLLDIVSLYPIE